MSTHTVWEYRVETMGSTFRSTSDEDVEETLNEWGLDGWEVIAFHPIQGSNKITIVARREQLSVRRKSPKSGFQW